MFLCLRPSFVMFGQALGRRFFLLCHALVKSRIFLFYPMSCLPRVARPPFGVMLWQKRGNYTPSVVIVRLGKAEAIQYKHLNHYMTGAGVAAG